MFIFFVRGIGSNAQGRFQLLRPRPDSANANRVPVTFILVILCRERMVPAFRFLAKTSCFLSSASGRSADAVDRNAQVVFREGEPANRFYLIISGKVPVESRSGGAAPVHIETLGTGDVLGWSWLFPGFAWHFQARALETTHVIACDGAHLLVRSEEDHDFGYELMNVWPKSSSDDYNRRANSLFKNSNHTRHTQSG